MITFNDPGIFLRDTTALARFLDYVQMDTTSNPESTGCPSSEGQRLLADRLAKELLDLGLADAEVDDNGYVLASLPGTTPRALGVIAHLDTSNACRGDGVQPLVHTNWDGAPIRLKNGIVLSCKTDPQLARCTGHTIVTSDGTTLLGADDKAGIAIIMGLLEYLQRHGDLPRPTLRVAFTPDEEIGRGVSRFPYGRFPVEAAFTLDGTFIGELNFETFEARSVTVCFDGVAVHPGQAKGRMVNALRAAASFIELLPEALRPECTADREGFIHPVGLSGDATSCTVSLIVRDFETANVERMTAQIQDIAASLQAREPRLGVKTDVAFTYPNMYKYLSGKPRIMERLTAAVTMAGVEPIIVPIRGGTDGAGLSMNGLPTPNIFTGAANLHGPQEWVSATGMGYALCTLLNLLTLYANGSAQ